MLSLRQSLAGIGKQPPTRIPGGFQMCPKSLREAIGVMNSPKPHKAAFSHRCVHSFTKENAQGLAYAYDTIWYLALPPKEWIDR